MGVHQLYCDIQLFENEKLGTKGSITLSRNFNFIFEWSFDQQNKFISKNENTKMLRQTEEWTISTSDISFHETKSKKTYTAKFYTKNMLPHMYWWMYTLNYFRNLNRKKVRNVWGQKKKITQANSTHEAPKFFEGLASHWPLIRLNKLKTNKILTSMSFYEHIRLIEGCVSRIWVNNAACYWFLQSAGRILKNTLKLLGRIE